ncbi:MAG: thiamine pyrophosphate-dependent enzyme [bacterium]|nr:thiamine pyrophosphate-dependent enzyme [bacterium]
MANLKELSKRPELLSGGHRLCAGCGAGIIARQVMMAAADKPVVVANATGCLEVSTTIYPFSAWKTSWFHSAFENAAASCSGMEAAYKALKRTGKVDKDIRFITFGGDGGTYDIGFQSLSGAMERRHRMLYVCYNNEAYMNTGIQRSSATPLGAYASTSPVGKVKKGKEQIKKDLTKVMVAHNIPYVGQTAVGYWNDLTTKVQKALETDGPTFINVLQPCRLGWGYNPADTAVLGRLAVETCFWPIYEVVDGKYKINVKPKEKKPITEYLKLQTRFKHLLRPENAGIVAEIQKNIDENWAWLQMMEECSNKAGV